MVGATFILTELTRTVGADDTATVVRASTAAAPAQLHRTTRRMPPLAVQTEFVEARFIRRRCHVGRTTRFSLPSSSSSANFRSIRCSAAAWPDCSRPMWRMLRRRSTGSCSELRRLQRSSSSAAIASTRTRSFLELLRTKLNLSPDCFQSRLLFGMHLHGPPKCSRVRSSRAIKWN